MVRMAALSLYGSAIGVILSFYYFPLVVTVVFILILGATHGALLGGLSQLASVFPDPCNGALLLGVDLAGVIPLLLVILVAVVKGGLAWGHVIFIVPAIISFIGIISLVLLLRSEMATQYLGQAKNLRRNVEGLETLLSRSGGSEEGDDRESINNGSSAANSEHYVSLSSFLSIHDTTSPKYYQQALAWGVLVFACTFCTYFMVPFFPESSKTHVHFPVLLFFVQHFADIVGRELLCVFVKNAVKGKLFMWALVTLRALIMLGWLVEVLMQPFNTSSVVVGVMEIGAVVLCGLVGGAINPAVYMLAGLRISDDPRDSVKAIRCCMWCSVAGSLAALVLLNVLAFVHPLSWGF